MKQTDTAISFFKEVKQNVVGGIRSRLDALSPQQRLHMVIGMFGILVVLLLFCIWQTVTDIASNKHEGTTIVIEHIDKPIMIGSVRENHSLTSNEKANGERRKERTGTGAEARRGLGQLIPGGTAQ